MNFKIDDIDVEITRKKIKNMNLRVCSPVGNIKVSAPKKMSVDSIHRFILSNLPWIRRQQKKIRACPVVVRKEYKDGESHYFNGNIFLLKIVASQKSPQVVLIGSEIIIYVNADATRTKKQLLLDKWYRDYLTEKTADLIAKWEKQMAVSVSRFSIRHMKTRWGSCSPKSRTIRINLALAKKSFACLEYVVVHELAHLLEASHNKRFVSLMDQYLPAWRLCRDALNSEPPL